MPHADFVHLRVRSAFSLLQSTVRVEALAKACRAAGMPAVAVTDDANLFGVMQFCAAAKKAGRAADRRAPWWPLAPLEALPRTPGRPAPPEHVVLLVKDATGYGNLLRLLSRAWVDAEPGAEIRVALDELGAHHARADLPDRRRRAGRWARRCGAATPSSRGGCWRELKAAFGDRLYVELVAARPGGGGRGRAGDARPRLRPRRAAGRHQRRALPGGRGLRRARRADLHRRGRPGGAGGPAPAHGRAPLQDARPRWPSCSPTCRRRSPTRW